MLLILLLIEITICDTISFVIGMGCELMHWYIA